MLQYKLKQVKDLDKSEVEITPLVKLSFWQNRIRNKDYIRYGLSTHEVPIYSYLDQSDSKIKILGLSAKTEQCRREQRSLYKMLERRLAVN